MDRSESNDLANNAGLFRKSGGGGTTFFSGVSFTNSGTVSVLADAVDFGGGGSGGGVFTAASGAALVFSDGYFFSPGAAVSGASRS